MKVYLVILFGGCYKILACYEDKEQANEFMSTYEYDKNENTIFVKDMDVISKFDKSFL